LFSWRRGAGVGCLLAGVGLLTGCETFYPGAPSEAELQRQEDMAILQERVQRVTGQLEGLQMESEALRTEVNSVRRERSSAAQGELRTLQSRLDDLEKRLRENDSARARDREEILNSLSARMADLLQKGGASRAPRESKSRSGYGYEHVVKSGESLSRIAAAYGVTVQAVQTENKMSSDVIRIGQKLFIPEK